MVNPDVELKALVALLAELQAQGIDAEAIVMHAKNGVLNGADYAPAGAAAKPHVVDVLEKALECAQPYLGK